MPPFWLTQPLLEFFQQEFVVVQRQENIIINYFLEAVKQNRTWSSVHCVMFFGIVNVFLPREPGHNTLKNKFVNYEKWLNKI